MKGKMMITKDKFEAYEAVRDSGATNMFDVKVVESLSGLNRDEILFIMENYGEILAKYQGTWTHHKLSELKEETK